MRISPPKLLLLVALLVVILVEARSVLAFFGLELSVEAIVVIGVITIGALVIWAVLPRNDDSE